MCSKKPVKLCYWRMIEVHGVASSISWYRTFPLNTRGRKEPGKHWLWVPKICQLQSICSTESHIYMHDRLKAQRTSSKIRLEQLAQLTNITRLFLLQEMPGYFCSSFVSRTLPPSSPSPNHHHHRGRGALLNLRGGRGGGGGGNGGGDFYCYKKPWFFFCHYNFNKILY